MQGVESLSFVNRKSLCSVFLAIDNFSNLNAILKNVSLIFLFKFTTDTSLFSRKETEKQKGNSYHVELSKFGLEGRADGKNIMKIFVSQLQKNSFTKHKLHQIQASKVTD